MKKDWTKKCTCENFQQNEDCEHIGDKVLEEVERQLPNPQREYSFDNQEFPECKGFNNCLSQVKQIIKSSKRTL